MDPLPEAGRGLARDTQAKVGMTLRIAHQPWPTSVTITWLAVRSMLPLVFLVALAAVLR
jgi:hypothetical protein